MIRTYDELNEVQIDVLREIGNIGAGHAATALSAMLNDKVEISIPKVKITDFNTAINALGGAETLTVGVLVNYSEEARGMIMFLLNMEDAQKITSILIYGGAQPEDNREEKMLSEMELSAIKEIGNILSSSYINAIATLTGLTISISIPYVAIDMAGALMSVPIIEFGSVGDKVMFIEENFSAGKDCLRSNVIMFAEIDTLKTIMERLGLEI